MEKMCGIKNNSDAVIWYSCDKTTSINTCYMDECGAAVKGRRRKEHKELWWHIFIKKILLECLCRRGPECVVGRVVTSALSPKDFSLVVVLCEKYFFIYLFSTYISIVMRYYYGRERGNVLQHYVFVNAKYLHRNVDFKIFGGYMSARW